MVEDFVHGFPGLLGALSTLGTASFWMVRFTGFSGSCLFSSLGLELAIFSFVDQGLVSSFVGRTLLSIALILASSLAPKHICSLALAHSCSLVLTYSRSLALMYCCSLALAHSCALALTQSCVLALA